MDRQIWLSVTEFQTRSSRPRFIVLTLPPHGRASARFQDEVAGPNRKGSTKLPTQPGDDNELPVTIAILRAILVRLGRACHANVQRYQPANGCYLDNAGKAQAIIPVSPGARNARLALRYQPIRVISRYSVAVLDERRPREDAA